MASSEGPGTPLLSKESAIRASSSLKKEHSAAKAIDGVSETCWNSDQGADQWIAVDLGGEARVRSISLSFQGGFSATQVVVEASDSGDSFKSARWGAVGSATCVDKNGEQVVRAAEILPSEGAHEDRTTVPVVDGSFAARKLRLVFAKATDFYGRIIVYHLQVYGSRT